jgi:hypothetical protein
MLSQQFVARSQLRGNGLFPSVDAFNGVSQMVLGLVPDVPVVLRDPARPNLAHRIIVDAWISSGLPVDAILGLPAMRALRAVCHYEGSEMSVRITPPAILERTIIVPLTLFPLTRPRCGLTTAPRVALRGVEVRGREAEERAGAGWRAERSDNNASGLAVPNRRLDDV